MIRLRRLGRVAWLPALLVAGASHAPAHPPARVVRAWPVMGTMFVASVWGRDTAAMLRAVFAARDSVRLVDSLMSTYRPSSDVSRANAAAGDSGVAVSPQTMHVLLRARLYWRLSGGLFDPTVGPLVRAWGFFGDSGRVPRAPELDSLRALVGFQDVELDSAALRVRLPRRGMMLDLGGIAKGYALDLARQALRGATITGGTVDLGGNVLAFGHPPAGRQWRIAIAHPRDNESALGTLSIDSGAVATSGDYEHFYMIGGVRYGHLVDPRTGIPARSIIAATVVGPTGEWSDGLSGTVYLAGARRGIALADSLPGVAAIVVREGAGNTVRAADLSVSRRARRWFRVAPALSR